MNFWTIENYMEHAEGTLFVAILFALAILYVFVCIICTCSCTPTLKGEIA